MYRTTRKYHYILLSLFILTTISILGFVFLYPSDNVENIADILPFLLILSILQIYVIKTMHVTTLRKTYNYIDFSFVVALLCGPQIFLLYLAMITIVKYYIKKELQTDNWGLRAIVQFFAIFTGGSIIHILGTYYLDFTYFLSINNLAIFALLVFIYNIFVSTPYTIMNHVDNRLSYKDSQDVFFKNNTDPFFIYFVYHSLLVATYYTFGLLGAVLMLAVLYLAEYHIEQNYLIKIESITDPLTGVYNRGYFDRLIQKYKEENRRFSVIMLDIDNFKNINETYNHLVGDYVLKEFAKVIQGSLRENDIIARYGGEEFCVVLENVSIENNIMIAERIRRNIEKKVYKTSYKNEIYEIKHTSSIGLGIYNNKHPNNVVEEADNNLKIAKHTGKNQVHFDDMDLVEKIIKERF